MKIKNAVMAINIWNFLFREKAHVIKDPKVGLLEQLSACCGFLNSYTLFIL